MIVYPFPKPDQSGLRRVFLTARMVVSLAEEQAKTTFFVQRALRSHRKCDRKVYDKRRGNLKGLSSLWFSLPGAS